MNRISGYVDKNKKCISILFQDQDRISYGEQDS